MSIASVHADRSVSTAAERGWRVLPASYAMPERRPGLVEAHEYSRNLARSHYENFSVASWFLPKRLRQHFFNVYAYCRIADDLGDEVGDPEASLALLDEWEAALDRCYDGTAVHPVFVALAETVREFDIPKHELSDFTCTALQLTNSWQDVAGDFAKGRVYLPQEDLRRFGVSETVIAGKQATAAFRELMRFEVDRAREWFRQGLPLVGLVQRELARDLELFSRGGMEILDAIAASGYDVLSHRPTLSKRRKLVLVARAAWSRMV